MTDIEIVEEALGFYGERSLRLGHIEDAQEASEAWGRIKARLSLGGRQETRRLEWVQTALDVENGNYPYVAGMDASAYLRSKALEFGELRRVSKRQQPGYIEDVHLRLWIESDDTFTTRLLEEHKP